MELTSVEAAGTPVLMSTVKYVYNCCNETMETKGDVHMDKLYVFKMENIHGQTRQKFSCLATMKREFTRVKLRVSNQRTLHQVSSTVVVQSYCGAVSLPELQAHCTKWME
ncbi:hypothetical protein ATANTOWER_025128 [Ataeniobius toweri]|uniref:NTR domain-containing protein n=1 Tax=Ataeniobius toweri TaxID=208326 RepID=A0ABU7ARV5_9TELE|nr:hypothetical protein [Ataeniobius toweri]